MMPDVMVLCPLPERQMEQLAARYTLHRHDLAADREAMLRDAGPRCEAIVTDGHTPLTRRMLAHLPRLRVVGCGSAGYEYIDLPALTERGVRLTYASPALADDVADTAIMLMLAARRGLIGADRHVRSGDWARLGPFPLQSAIAGKRLGIAGMGPVGRAIAVRARAMRLDIAYTARSPKPDQPLRFEPDLTALAHWADILIVIVAGGAGTRGLVDAGVIAALGPQGTLVNVSRGTVVDEAALIAALAERRLGSAGLDVFRNEPDPDPRFASLPNVVLYPHHASGTAETRDAMAQLVVDNLAAHFDGQPLISPVN
jgi:lactate dehydrogenase-like 2-hydroxyacid dehydrogenase